MPREDYDISVVASSGSPVHKSEEVAIAIQKIEDAIVDFVRPETPADMEVINLTAASEHGEAFGLLIVVAPDGEALQLTRQFAQTCLHHVDTVEEQKE